MTTHLSVLPGTAGTAFPQQVRPRLAAGPTPLSSPLALPARPSWTAKRATMPRLPVTHCQVGQGTRLP